MAFLMRFLRTGGISEGQYFSPGLGRISDANLELPINTGNMDGILMPLGLASRIGNRLGNGNHLGEELFFPPRFCTPLELTCPLLTSCSDKSTWWREWLLPFEKSNGC